LVDREITHRRDKRLAARLRYAKLRHHAAVEDVDYRAPRGLDRALFHKLAGGEWIDAHDNLILCGPTVATLHSDAVAVPKITPSTDRNRLFGDELGSAVSAWPRWRRYEKNLDGPPPGAVADGDPSLEKLVAKNRP
jgi:IstB-like ATP binding protein